MTNSHSSQDPVLADLQWTLAGTEASAPVYDCWNTIGVSGNGSCRELPRFTHCRNCPVYSAAAAQLLDRPAPAELRREWTEHYAREKKLTTPTRASLVLFRLGNEWLALPTLAFQEVAEQRTIHTLPHRRHGLVLGLVNMRGELLICASLGRLLELEPPASARELSRAPHRHPGSAVARPKVTERLLVTRWHGQRLVFPVDEVHGIQRVPQDELRPPPATVARANVGFMRSIFQWETRTVGVLDADDLFATVNRQLA